MTYIFAHRETSTKGAPLVIAIMFLLLIPPMLFLPIAEITIEEVTSPHLLINIINTESGFNPFAFVLLPAPAVGVVESIRARPIWREALALIAFLAIVSLFLTFSVLNSQIHRMGQGAISVSIGFGGYILIAGYTTILLITGIAAFRKRYKGGRIAP